MPEIAARLSNVSKLFQIYDHPRDRLKELLSFSRKRYHTDYVALQNINLDIRKGEFLGVVGKNGAGKSTLLKMLSGEISPTTGTVEIFGKVSLLQLGVGFDPELSGIENARFASKLLGFSDRQINEMILEIVEFADIGDFINHPVKFYSSGMYSRLSFAVGININPDILIADEVLSVGDMRFSQKCLRKMHEFKKAGKTVIFVSHDTSSVNAFCDTAIWLKDGEIFMQGDAKDVTQNFQNFMLYNQLPQDQEVLEKRQHLSDSSQYSGEGEISPNGGYSVCSIDHKLPWVDVDQVGSVGDNRAKILKICLVNANTNKVLETISGDEHVRLFLYLEAVEDLEQPQLGFVLYNRHGLPACHTNNDICGTSISYLNRNTTLQAEFSFKLPSLANGSYSLSVAIQTGLQMAHKLDDVLQVSVFREGIKGTQCGFVIIEKEAFLLKEVKG